MKTKEYRIFGRVQGVGFRYSARQEAEKLSLNGWVKNESDGSVTIQAWGVEQALERFEAWCHLGPGTANVQNVTIREIPEKIEKYGFQIK